MLIGITSNKEIDKYIRRMRSVLKPFGLKKYAHISSRMYKRDYARVPNKYAVLYSQELGIWWHLGDTHNRYWNCFGVDNPERRRSSFFITIEINMPFEGKNFRVSGLWAKDNNGNVYLMHDGGIGGGKKGISRSLFSSYFTDDFNDVSVNGFVREYYLVAQLNDIAFPYQLANFIKQIRILKDNVGKYKKSITVGDKGFTPEFYGLKSYNLPDKIISNCNHGLVVNTLKDKLSDLEIHNNRFMDLYSVSGKKVTHIFEVKTGLSRQSVYTAIGQLMLNSASFEKKPDLYFVCPEGIDNDLIIDLNKFKIKVLKYNWSNNKPVFTNMEIIN